MAISRSQLRAKAALDRQRLRNAVNRYNAAARKAKRDLERLRRACK